MNRGVLGARAVQRTGARASSVLIAVHWIVAALALSTLAFAKDDWEKYDHAGPVQKEHVYVYRELAEKARVEALAKARAAEQKEVARRARENAERMERDTAQCEGAAHSHFESAQRYPAPRVFADDFKACMTRRGHHQGAKP